MLEFLDPILLGASSAIELFWKLFYSPKALVCIDLDLKCPKILSKLVVRLELSWSDFCRVSV